MGGFTLVELMVVIAIALILMTLSVIAVRGAGKSANLVNGGHKISASLQLARQQAMTNNTLTAMILLKSLGSEDDYRAFTVLTYQPKQGWKPSSSWEILPEGILMREESSYFLSSHPTIPFSQEGTPISELLFRGQKIGDQFAWRVFLPVGGILNPEQEAQIELVEGYRQGNQQVLTNAKDGEPHDKLELTLIGVTGRVKVYRP